ncbi:MAG: hypothetical protein WB217_17110 [Mesobacillus sp.]|uniref:hypothetical protein n=1 Tax=Mesobacillus sp. TaxID=2675271 RepID=UPI003C5D9CB4
MTTFLLLLSLTLNAAAIFAIILLYLRQNRLVEAEKKQGRIIGEIEEVFSSYLLEIKEENEKFIENIKSTNKVRKNEIEIDSQIHPKSINPDFEPYNSPDKEQEEELRPRMGRGVSYHTAKKAYQQNSEPSSVKANEAESNLEDDLHIIDDSSELQQLSFIDQVFQKKNQGLSIEEIARDLHKGKTEIELLLKFRQNK